VFFFDIRILITSLVSSNLAQVQKRTNLVLLKFQRYGYATTTFSRPAEQNEKKVAVIGTGVSGISALRNLTSPHGNIKPVAFERSSSFGGHWSFTGEMSRDTFGYPPSSAIYCGLR
jgi:heterodisulfide reductase subunit A-like polyferredoxin